MKGAPVLPLVLALAGCHHVIEPIEPPLLPVEDGRGPFPGGAAIRLENGHAAPEMRRLLSEGIHRLDIDLRDWTGRLVLELEKELVRRQVSVIVAGDAVAGTPAAPPVSPPGRRAPPGSHRTLRVRVMEVNTPSSGRPLVAARLEGEDGKIEALHDSGTQARGYRDALLELKKRIIEDEGLRKWAGGNPSPKGNSDG